MSNDYDTEQGNWQDYVNPTSGVPRIGISPQGGNGVSQLINTPGVGYTPSPNEAAPDSSGLAKLINRLFGTGGEERYQFWPERMARSGFSLPRDVMTNPALTSTLKREDVTDEPRPGVGAPREGGIPGIRNFLAPQSADISDDRHFLHGAGGRDGRHRVAVDPRLFCAREAVRITGYEAYGVLKR